MSEGAHERIVHRMGDRALLVELADPDGVRGLDAALRAASPVGLLDVVPAARTILVTFADMAGADAAMPLVRELPPQEPEAADAPTAELEVRYDGPDLADVAAHLGLAPDALVQRHRDAVWRVDFGGFVPGFAYLSSDDWDVDVPRRDTPRTRVPAGAVGLAGPWTGAYPRPSPGGWQLVATTTATLFDVEADPPALLVPGTVVHLREATA